MGVPAFFRYMSERYPKIIEHLIEDRGATDLDEPLPQYESNGYEFDNLYIDMNGIIHPCAHPEDRPAPTSELEMYHNVTTYVDRLFAAVRPRKLLYLAIDGVAPRAKMNQQRSRRFRAAQDAAERNAIMKDIKGELGLDVEDIDPSEADLLGKEWDSNVITPGTPFMHRLSDYLRWYVTERINNGGPAWRNVAVVLSDASEPGEGEHKIMSYIRQQRTQPGYNPNLRHVLHGLDADLIMLGLALHEAHFTVLREEVRFGREKASQSKASMDQETFDKLKGNGGMLAVDEGARWCYDKPFVMCRISVLREYLAVEFGGLAPHLPFAFDFERIVDDFVFLCFFVGNDFLPHLPTLDIRDGALDFLFNVYKRVLPTLGGYLTAPGGAVNLEHVDVVLAEVGAIEDEVFRRRKGADDADKVHAAQRKARSKVGVTGGAGGLERLALIANGDAASAVAVGKPREKGVAAAPAGAHEAAASNLSAAAALRASLMGSKPRSKPVSADTAAAPVEEQEENDVAEELPEELPPPSLFAQALVKPSKLSPEEKAAKEAAAEEVYKAKASAMLDEYKEKIEDEVRFWQAGWKDRYYADKYKEADIAKGGGRARVFQEYVRGLCWVMAYYYDGCASWKWYYPFHYAPFASDLRNVEQYACEFDSSEPFRPIEQLMAVLPKESHAALPQVCHDLMLLPDSPIADFYPHEVEIDPNGKAMPWLWVALLPFIDEERLLANLAKVYPLFDDAAHDRNRFRTATVFAHEQCPNLGPALAQLFAPQPHGAAASAAGVALDCAAVGVGGTVTLPREADHPHAFACHVRAPGATVTAPLLPRGRYVDVTSNRCVALQFADPPKAPHKSELLVGAVLPEPKLSPYDMHIKVPRLNRGLNIADLGSGGQGNGKGGGGKGFGDGKGGNGKGGGKGQYHHPPGPALSYQAQQMYQFQPPPQNALPQPPPMLAQRGMGYPQPQFNQGGFNNQGGGFNQFGGGQSLPDTKRPRTNHYQQQQQHGYPQQPPQPQQQFQQQYQQPQQGYQQQQQGYQQQMAPQQHYQQQMAPQQHYQQMAPQQQQQQQQQHGQPPPRPFANAPPRGHTAPQPFSVAHPGSAAPPTLDSLRSGLAQTLARRGAPYQHQHP